MKLNSGGDELRLCEKCNPRHYENCWTCFGYGLKQSQYTKDGTAIVTAHEAVDACEGKVEIASIICPECGSQIIDGKVLRMTAVITQVVY